MKIQTTIVTATVAFAALVSSPTINADVVTEWNEIMQVTVAAGNANIQARSGAIAQLAVYEAVNSIVGEYEPYLGTIDAPEWASPDAAAAAAAHGVLVVLYPVGDWSRPSDLRLVRSSAWDHRRHSTAAFTRGITTK